MYTHTHTHTHTIKIINYLRQTLPHSYMPYIELGTVVKNCSRDLQPFTTLTKSTRRVAGIYIYCIFKPYFSNYNGRTI